MHFFKHIGLLAATFGCLWLPLYSWADKPIRIIIPFPSGGGMDKMGRAIAAELIGTPTGKLVVENRPGADGLIAVDQVLQKTESNNSVLMVNPYFTTALANGKLSAEKASRFKPLIHLGDLEIYLIAAKRTMLKNLSDVNFPVAKPWSCAASPGQFSTICDRLALDFPNGVIAVPYKGETQALNDLLGGHIDFMPITRISAEPHISAGTVTLLANLSSPQTGKKFSGMPFLRTTGITSFFGFVVTDEMPEATAHQLNQDINRIIQSASFTTTARAIGMDLVGGSSRKFELFLRDNVASQKRLMEGLR